MKHQLLILILIICSMVVCATSCNSFVSSSGVGQSGNETQNHEIDSINDQTLIFEQKTEDNTKVDSIPLVFDDYADFILYGTKGELDSSKYSNADILISNYRFNRESFVDIKSLLDLSNELPKGMSEEVVIEKNNEYAYYVYSRDELNRLKTEYRITVKYFDNRSNIAYNESIVRINNISDMLNRSGTFVYQNKDYDILYNKSGTSYKSISLINSNLSIGVFFEGDGATQSQIAEKCGDVVSKLVSDDTAVLNQTIDRMNDILPNSSSQKSH